MHLAAAIAELLSLGRFAHIAMFNKITEQVRRFFGVLPVSYELSGESILTRSGISVRELVRITDIESWRPVASDTQSRFGCARTTGASSLETVAALCGSYCSASPEIRESQHDNAA